MPTCGLLNENLSKFTHKHTQEQNDELNHPAQLCLIRLLNWCSAWMAGYVIIVIIIIIMMMMRGVTQVTNGPDADVLKGKSAWVRNKYYWKKEKEKKQK